MAAPVLSPHPSGQPHLVLSQQVVSIDMAAGAVVMAKNTSISLGGHFASFVDRQLAEGRFGSASEVVRAGLRLPEEQEVKLAALRAALLAGERSGPPRPSTSTPSWRGNAGRSLGERPCPLARRAD
jgi:antitoxin ParD1/3/4